MVGGVLPACRSIPVCACRSISVVERKRLNLGVEVAALHAPFCVIVRVGGRYSEVAAPVCFVDVGPVIDFVIR